jgi:hypothetical protein
MSSAASSSSSSSLFTSVSESLSPLGRCGFCARGCVLEGDVVKKFGSFYRFGRESKSGKASVSKTHYFHYFCVLFRFDDATCFQLCLMFNGSNLSFLDAAKTVASGAPMTAAASSAFSFPMSCPRFVAGPTCTARTASGRGQRSSVQSAR